MMRVMQVVALCSLVCLIWSTSAYCDPDQALADAETRSGTPLKFEFKIASGYGVRSGFTEYEIEAGYVRLGSPSGEQVNTGSRLRFPIDSRLLNLSFDVEYGRLAFTAATYFQLSNSMGTFKDYDWFDLSGSKHNFIFGTADSDDQTFHFDADLGLKFYTGRFLITPKIRFAYTKMEFEETGANQTDYYAIAFDEQQGYWLDRLEDPVNTSLPKTTKVLTYEADYKVLYAGVAAEYESPVGLTAQVSAFVSPVAKVETVDNHLVRDPAFEATIKVSNGTSALLDFGLGYRISEFVRAWSTLSYTFLDGSGNEHILFFDTPPWTYFNDKASIRSEWTTASVGLSITLPTGR